LVVLTGSQLILIYFSQPEAPHTPSPLNTKDDWVFNPKYYILRLAFGIWQKTPAAGLPSSSQNMIFLFALTADFCGSSHTRATQIIIISMHQTSGWCFLRALIGYSNSG